VQFLSGLVILIEIVGQQRIERFATATSQLLEALAKAQPLREVSRGLWDTSRYFLLFLVTTGEKEAEYLAKSNAAKYDTPALWASSILAVVSTLVIIATQFPFTVSLLWKAPAVLVGAMLASALFVYLIAINVLLVPIILLLRPLEFVFDQAAHATIAMLKQTTLSRLFLVASLILYIASFVLELAAS